MLATELINAQITALRPSDTVSVALGWMEEWRIGQLPVVDKGRLLGLIGADNLLAVEDEATPVGELPLLAQEVSVHPKQRLFEFVHYFAAYEIEMIPVLDEQQRFLGVVGERNVFRFFTKAFSAETGGLILLSMDYRDYSLSEIARLVEANNVRVVGSLLEVSTTEANKVMLTLKLNTNDLQYPMATLQRFGYQVVAEFQWQTNAASIESERLGSLLRYLQL